MRPPSVSQCCAVVVEPITDACQTASSAPRTKASAVPVDELTATGALARWPPRLIQRWPAGSKWLSQSPPSAPCPNTSKVPGDDDTAAGSPASAPPTFPQAPQAPDQIGRASCRERV